MRHVEVSLMEEDELSIDGQTKPAGKIEIREFKDEECMGGIYKPSWENAMEHIKEYLNES